MSLSDSQTFHPPISDEALSLVSACFRALGEPSRLRILRALEERERSISDLVEVTGLTQTNVSRHVQILVKSGIVGRRKEGLSVICFIDDPLITELCHMVCGNLVKRLGEKVKMLEGAGMS